MMSKDESEMPAGSSRHLGDLKKIAEGGEAAIYHWDEGRVLRLFFDPRDTERAHTEAVAIKAAARVGLRTLACYGEVTMDGRPGLILERLEGIDLGEETIRRWWRIRSIGHRFAEMHAAVHTCTSIRGLPSYLGRVRYRFILPSDLRGPFKQGVRPILERLKTGEVLYHGDLHLGNVVIHNGEPVVIDWSSAGYAPPEADVAITLVMMDVMELPPGLPLYKRLLSTVVLKVLRRTYLDTYRQHNPLDEAALEDWYTVQLLLRLGIKRSETQAIKKLLTKRLEL